ncbi:MAG: IS200/IS605 family transposase [Anaerolineales bacterium]|nr:IS200/IS605 family transposase [Anaerolineales bacterium]
MPADILVITSSSQLGESIRRPMEETGIYRIHIVTNKASAIVRADEIGAPLAMLDYSANEEWVQDIGSALRTIHPGINIIILCDDGVTPPSFDKLRPWILVRKPFRMSNFMTAISQPQTASVTQNGETAPLPWLSDPNKAAQHLTRLTLESSAQAALITRKNSLWAYAGSLSQNAAKEVAQTVTRNWDGQKGSDLLRFIRLESTKAEHMLYATRLATDTVLALVFDAETPFSTIRSQASQLVTDLDNDERPEPQKPSMPAQSPANLDQDDLQDIPPIANILNNVPTPNPEPTTTHNFRLPPKKEVFDPNETRVSAPLSNVSAFKREASPAIHYNKIPVTPNQAKGPVVSEQSSQAVFDQVEVTAPSRPRSRPETPIAKPMPGELSATRESPTTEAARKLVVEPTTAGLYHLTYACLLVPRFSAHYITGDLADQISEWLPNICIAFGWRLEYLSVRPDYLQWVANVQPNTSPGYLMRIMRQQTSEKIFSEFPRMKKENPSGDFWAPGYLIMGGTQPHPQQLVRDYIRQTRQRQGQEIPPEPRETRVRG